MSLRTLFALSSLVACLPTSLRAETAHLRLDSPQDGASLEPGARVDWSISLELAGESDGLALALVDLTQDPANPEPIDIAPAARVPAGMERFDRPLGFSNPAFGEAASGYLGTAVPSSTGGSDLAQIGGAQNTFGVTGESMGQSTAIVQGVGLDGEIVLAHGSLTAPSIPGTYRFVVRDPRVNVLSETREAPLASLVEAAEIDASPASFEFVIEAAGCNGDCFVRGNCDGEGELTITDAIVLLSFNFLGNSSPPPCLAACDANGDGTVTGSVTDAVYLLGFLFLGGPPPLPPFPDCGAGMPSDAALGCMDHPTVCQ